MVQYLDLSTKFLIRSWGNQMDCLDEIYKIVKSSQHNYTPTPQAFQVLKELCQNRREEVRQIATDIIALMCSPRDPQEYYDYIST